jgi:ATP phosphoribosyltransferase
MSKQVLRFGLPKGSLQESALQKMQKAGWNVSVSSRSYVPYVDDEELEIRLIRAQEISRYVENGVLDAGITGQQTVPVLDHDTPESLHQRIHAAEHELYPQCVAALARREIEVRGRRVVGKPV